MRRISLVAVLLMVIMGTAACGGSKSVSQPPGVPLQAQPLSEQEYVDTTNALVRELNAAVQAAADIASEEPVYAKEEIVHAQADFLRMFADLVPPVQVAALHQGRVNNLVAYQRELETSAIQDASSFAEVNQLAIERDVASVTQLDNSLDKD